MLAKTPSRVADYLEAIERLAPLIAEHRAAFDNERRLPDVVFNALADAGLFRLWLPEALGGPELSPADFMTVVEAASALDGSVGWLVGNGGGMSRIGGYLPEPVARKFFSDPRAFVTSATGAVGTAQKVEGGYRVTGRWPFGSGAHHASHFMGLASLKGADGKDEPPLCCYFERRDVVIHDTWRVSGLRATGSCDFEVRDLFVPEQHTHIFIGARPTQDGIVYRLPGAVGIRLDCFRRPARNRARRDERLRGACEPEGPDGRQRAAARSRDRAKQLRPGGRVASRGARFPDRSNDRTDGGIGRGGTAPHQCPRGIQDGLHACRRKRGAHRRHARRRNGSGRDLRDVADRAFCPRHSCGGEAHRDEPNNYVVSGRVGLGLDPGTPRF